MRFERNFLVQIGKNILGLILLLSSLQVLGATTNNSFQSGNSTPTVSAVSLNNGSAITLTANATTTVRVNLTVTDNNGCGEVFFSGRVTTTVLRSGVGEGCTFSYENCYIATTTASSFTHSCPSLTSTQTSANATATFDIYYFAQATDASSSFPSNTWFASVRAEDASSSAHTASSTGIELNTLLAIDTTTSTNYGTVNPGENTSSTNQIVEVRNAGNSSSSLNINGTAMCNGSICISTSSQHYATSTFTYGGVEQALQETATLVSGFLAPPQPLGPSWTNTTALPSGREISTCLENNGYLYRLGGIDGGFALYNEVYFTRINATGSISNWSSTTPLPDILESFGGFAYNNRIYSVGGNTQVFGTGQTSTVHFAPISATGSVGVWVDTTPLPSPIGAHRAISYGGYAYSLGGVTSGGSQTSTVFFGQINATGSISNWSSTTPLPYSPIYFSTAIHNNYLYAMGGELAGGVRTSTVYYAPINATGSLGSWQAATHVPFGFTHNENVAFTYDEKIYFFPSATNTLFAVIRTDGSLGRWQDLPDHSNAFGCALRSGQYVYDIGGFTSSTVDFNRLPSQSTYWGFAAPAGYAQGLYSGTNTAIAVFSP